MEEVTGLVDNNTKKLLEEIRKVIGGHKIYLIGGFVRDLFIKKFHPHIQIKKENDIDLVIVGNLSEVIEQLKTSEQMRITRVKDCPEFGTGTYIFELPAENVKVEIDFATARKEIYAKPAALPTVTHAQSIDDDIDRRGGFLYFVAVT